MKVSFDLNNESTTNLVKVRAMIDKELESRAPKKAVLAPVTMDVYLERVKEAQEKKKKSPPAQSKTREQKFEDDRQKWWNIIVEKGWANLEPLYIFKNIESAFLPQQRRVITYRGRKHMTLMYIVRLRKSFKVPELRPTPIDPESKTGKLLYKKEPEPETEVDEKPKNMLSDSQLERIRNMDFGNYKDRMKQLNLIDLVKYCAQGRSKLTWDYASRGLRWIRHESVYTLSRGEIELTAEENFEFFLDLNKKLLTELGVL